MKNSNNNQFNCKCQNFENKQIVSGIYKIENLITHKVYIGQSVNIYHRWLAHKSNSINKNSTQYNKHLYSAMRKYGIENFSFEIIKRNLRFRLLGNFLDSNLSCD